MGRITYLAIVLVGVALPHLTVAATPTVVTAKCTPKDPRKDLYPECMQSESLVLWCDFSSYRSVPDPDTIYESKSCNNSIALYINDSCLPALHQHEIRKYPNIEDLHCGKNFIKKIERRLFTYNGKLRTLNFDTNLIDTVHARAFSGLSKLEILDLANNKISSISDPEMFRGLTSLKDLSLQGNQIQVLRPYTFQLMTRLEVLVLRGNKISHIDKLAFHGLKNLVRLHLDGNELTTLDEATFQSTPKLRVLTFSYNKFSVVPTFAMNSLTNLHTLNLGHNLLRELAISRIANLSKLQNLSLENNSIPVVSEDSFHHMPSLRFLNLSSNGIEEVNQCSFSKSCHLEELNLSNNTLKTPNPEWFTSLIQNEAVEGTDISGNQWKCDCKAITFYEFQADLPVSWKNKLTITCDWPKEHFGKNLSDVIHSLKNDPNCKNAPYNKIERPCNSSIPLPTKETQVYTYLPTTTDEDSPELTSYMKEETEPAAHYAERKDIKSPDESLNFYLLIALCATCVIVVGLVIFVVKILRRKSICEEDKSDSTEKMVPSHPLTSRCDSEGSCEDKRHNSTATVNTVLSRSSRSSLGCQSDEYSSETTPLQPQDDLKSGSEISSDSGINSCPSSLSPSEVTLSIESNASSDCSVLEVINENEVFDAPQPSVATTIGETTPKKVLHPNQDSSQDDDEFLMFGPREQPIGGNADGEVC